MLGRLLALRSLRARPLRSVLSCIGIGAGVALVLAIQLINTAIADSVRSTVDAVAGRAQAEVAAPTDGGVDESVVTRLAALPSVDVAVGIVRADGVLATTDKRRVVTLLGVPANYQALAPAALPTTLDGSFGGSGASGVVLPAGLARGLGVAAGDRLTLAVRTARADVLVTGILRGDAASDSAAGIALMALPEAQRILGLDGRVDQALVVPRDPRAGPALRREIAETLPAGLTVRSPAARATQTDRILRGIRQLLTLASTVALFVGMFVVYNTMAMATTERRRELALLQALGLRRREEERLIYLEAGLLGVGGALLGVGAGYALARLLVARVAEGYAVLIVLPPVRVRPSVVVLALAFASGVVAAVVAAILPARRLRALPPVEGMRAGTPTEDHGEATPALSRVMAVAVPAVLAGVASMAVFLTVAGDQVGFAVAGLAALMLALAAVIPIVVPAVLRVAVSPVLRRSPLVGHLAEQSLLRAPRRTSFTTGALLITLMLVVGMGGALGSFRRSLDQLIGVVARGDVYVVAEDVGTTSLPSDLAADIAAVDGVAAVWRFRFQGVLWGDDQVALQSWDMAPYRKVGGLILESGELEAAWDAVIAGTGVVVSTTLAADRDLAVGDRVELPAPGGPVAFDVVGVSTDFLPQGTFLLDWDTATRLYGDAGAASIAVVGEAGRIGDVRSGITAAAARRGVPVKLETREQRAGAVLGGIDRTFALADGVQLAGLVVALIAVLNTLLMTVVERHREIGMLRALGLLRRQVRRLVMAEALVIGLVGGTLAAAAGYVLSLLVTRAMEVGNRWSQVPFVPWRAMLLAPVAAAVVAALGGWWPAARAARVEIVEAIRSE